MRRLLLTLAMMGVFQAYAQTTGGSILSAILVDPDSLPVPDVMVINSRTYHTVRTDENGYFETEIAENDSLFIYHIAFKRQFINENKNGKIIVLEPQLNEISQVDVTDNALQELINLQSNLQNIERVALEKKFEHSDHTDASRQEHFLEQQGSHNKGFKPFFGPTIHLPLEQIGELIDGNEDKQQGKELTSPYPLEKSRSNEKEK